MSLIKLMKRRPIPSHPPHKPRKRVIKGPDGKIIDLSKKLRKKSKPTSTAREKAIASKAVKPKANKLYARVLARGQAGSRDRHPPKRRK